MSKTSNSSVRDHAAETLEPRTQVWTESSLTIALLFAGTMVLWGTSAIVTRQQASEGGPSISVAIRMALVSLIMFGFCRVTAQPMWISRTERPWVAAQGALFFGLSFIAFYRATTMIPSGIAALVLSMSSVVAAAVSFIFTSAMPTKRLVLGLVCGVVGLGIVVFPQFGALASDEAVLGGIGWAAIAACAAGAGSVLAGRNQNRGVPIPALLGWGALAGAALATVWGMLNPIAVRLTLSVPYVLGLLYLTLFASCATFFMYFRLVRCVGPAAASYTLSGVPCVALLLSALFEGLTIDLSILAGAAVILAGNILVMRPTAPSRRSDQPSGP